MRRTHENGSSRTTDSGTAAVSPSHNTFCQVDTRPEMEPAGEWFRLTGRHHNGACEGSHHESNAHVNHHTKVWRVPPSWGRRSAYRPGSPRWRATVDRCSGSRPDCPDRTGSLGRRTVRRCSEAAFARRSNGTGCAVTGFACRCRRTIDNRSAAHCPIADAETRPAYGTG